MIPKILSSNLVFFSTLWYASRCHSKAQMFAIKIPKNTPSFSTSFCAVQNRRFVNWTHGRNSFHLSDKHFKQEHTQLSKIVSRYFMNYAKQIEVEKKVRLETHHLVRIEKEGTFIEEIKFQDIYFDRADYSLTAHNIWLRQREKKFELKIGIKGVGGFSDRYEEIKDEQKILEQLGLTPKQSEKILDTLSRSGVIPFASFITQRKRYQLDGLAIDIDIADFGDLTYRVAEFEAIVSSTDQVNIAEDKIKKTLHKLQIDASTTVPAKLTYYLYNKRPHHYKILVDNSVIQPIATSHIK